MSGTGIGINMMGMVHNYGSWTVEIGLSIIDGTFVNIGSMNVAFAAVVVQANGALYNIGTIVNNVDVAIVGEYQECGTVVNTPIRNAGGTIGSSVPMGTPCDDMDDTTIDDVLVDSMCTCEGTPAAPIPTLTFWGSLTLLLLMVIFGTRQFQSLASYSTQKN